ncbi:hypothetical protein GCM10009000_074610 [Halobacterium noricense]|uniref:Transposase n=1 Tax=Haladaptatus pallidirubidus TaxID=1008152 RepID=A0AAV3UMQ1_9EURY
MRKDLNTTMSQVLYISSDFFKIDVNLKIEIGVYAHCQFESNNLSGFKIDNPTKSAISCDHMS